MKINWSVPVWMVSDEELFERLRILKSNEWEVKSVLPVKNDPFNTSRFTDEP